MKKKYFEPKAINMNEKILPKMSRKLCRKENSTEVKFYVSKF